MNICIVSSLGPVLIPLLGTFVYKFFGAPIFNPLGVYLGVELPIHMLTLCLIFYGTPKLFSQAVDHFTFQPAMCVQERL